MGYINMQLSDGTGLSIVSGEVVPFVGLHQNPGQLPKPAAQEAHEVGMGDGSWPPSQTPVTV